MPKTLETTLREKIATGYDPITISVSPRDINQENITVTIEGVLYSISGNDVSNLTPRLVEPAADAEVSTPASEPVDESQPAETAPLTPTGAEERLAGIAAAFGPGRTAAVIGTTPDGEPVIEVTEVLVDGEFHVVTSGTFDQLEKLIAETQAAAASVA